MKRSIFMRLLSIGALAGASWGLTPFLPAQSGAAQTMTLGDLTFSVYPRIFSPNGDSYNDKAAFHFSNPEDLPVQGEVFDIAGAKVADLKPGGPDPASLLLWDGKDTDGRAVPGGIYLYQLEFQGKRATGSVVVAR